MNRDPTAERLWATRREGDALPPVERFARSNRKTPTDAERKLWTYLRRLEVKGSHFRRQVVIGEFIADFACRRSKVIIEVDGGQHAESVADVRRTAILEANGWRVLRFWNNDVLTNIEGVMTAIVESGAASFCATPTPDPSPQGGGEKGAP
jgi:very-short-patch-repair endonuclease